MLALSKPLVFACNKVVGSGPTAVRVKVVRGVEAHRMLENCSVLVDVEAAQCAVPEDKRRELAAIGEANFGRINRTVGAAMAAGAAVAEGEVTEVDAFNCGELEPLRALPAERVCEVFAAACSAGQLAVLVGLRRVHGGVVAAYLAGKGGDGNGGWESVFRASVNGRLALLYWLLGETGASAEATKPETGCTSINAAVQRGHLDIVKALIESGANVDQARDDGVGPLAMAAELGRVDCLRVLIDAGANVDGAKVKGYDGSTANVVPLCAAAAAGYLEPLQILVAAGASVDLAGHPSSRQFMGPPSIALRRWSRRERT